MSLATDIDEEVRLLRNSIRCLKQDFPGDPESQGIIDGYKDAVRFLLKLKRKYGYCYAV